MPASRPRASFEPIPPDFDLRTFGETSDNFHYADRISYEMIASNGMDAFEKLVLLHVVLGGKPLVVDGFDEILDPWTFTPAWLRDNHGDKVENARNLTTKENIPLTVRHYLKHMGKLTDQFFDHPERYRDKTRQRIYLKDIDCPQVWQDKLKEHIPQMLYYLNESTGEIGGPGAVDEPGGRKGRGIARAGDLMSSLPPEMRAENLMCYIGHEGTYTPAHREMSASLGQNIMVNASTNMGEDGKPEHPGSSIWFMTETKDRHLVSEYWLSVLGHDIEVENHFAQLIAWKKAPFKTYVVEQKPGDFILIPPLAPHQVWNRGTRTMKIAWNRTTAETLELALSEALPNSRMVCRDEQYKNKAIVYYTLLKYSNLIKTARAMVERGGEQARILQSEIKVRQVQRDFKKLFDLFKSILLSETFAPDSREHPEFIPFDSNVTCAYCRCNIFNRFLTCKACPLALGTPEEEPYDVCMDCYAMGRSCACQSGYAWVEQWKWKDLVTKYEEWRAQIIDIDGRVTDKTPLPLAEERRYLGRKTLAHVCQEQLKVRPFVDIKAPPPPEDESDDEEIQINEDGTVKKMVKKRSKQWLANHKACHFCLHRHPKWKMAFCTQCDLAYCYGSLFRAHDMMPLTVMENFKWMCPHCQRVCNRGACKRDPRQHPYEPKGTLLGHDTRKVADVRSVESLVDFSVSNLNWLREDDENVLESQRLQRRRIEADLAKQNDPAMDPRFMDEDRVEPPPSGIQYSPAAEDSMIDPSLRGEHAFGSPAPGGDLSMTYPDPEQPFHQGYVEPAAVIYGYQPDDRSLDDNFGTSYYPDLDMHGEIPRTGNKRHRADDEDEEDIQRVGAPKKQKKKRDETAQSSQPKTASGKQYQKEVERKLLEDAKKEDRFILVAARMKGKSRIVRLKLAPEQLARFREPEPAQPTQTQQPEAVPQGTASSILESDVLPPTNGVSQAGGPKPKAPKSFKVRVEMDEDFQAGAAPSDRPRYSRQHYEEVTLESDEENDEDFMEYMTFPRTSRKKRDSQWLAKRNEGYEDLPTELPPDFRDGTVNPKQRERDRARRRTMPHSKSQAQIRPTGGARRARNSTGNLSDEDGDHEDNDAESALVLAQSAAAAVEASRKAQEEAVRKEAEENLRAKMAIADWTDGTDEDESSEFIDAREENDNFDEEESDEEAEFPDTAPVRAGPPKPAPNSIFSRPGMVGRKIKIVSAKHVEASTASAPVRWSVKRAAVDVSTTSAPAAPERRVAVGTTKITAPINSFTAINKDSPRKTEPAVRAATNIVQLSDSEDEAPARPVVIRNTAIPSRGNRGRARGRGRPRGT